MNISKSVKSFLNNKVFNVLPPALLLSLSLFFFGPMNVYRGNINEFKTGFISIISIYIIPFCVLLFIMLLVGLVFPKKYVLFYIIILFSIGILLWLQGNIIVWEYGVFDGEGINWGDYTWRGIIDISIWICFLALAIAFRKRVLSFVNFASISLIALQIIMVVIVSFSSGHTIWLSSRVGHEKSTNELYKYSSDYNIVHIIMDAFQSDVFMEIIEEENLQSRFDGFTFFKENIAAAPLTSLAVPAVFSGEVFDGSNTVSENFEESISEKGFHNKLYDNGYNVNLIPMLNMPTEKYSNYYRIPEIYGASQNDQQLHDATYLFDITLFRYLPHYFKSFIYNESNWRLGSIILESPNVKAFSDLAFLSDYSQKIYIEDSTPAYHFIHILPPHPPYVIDVNGKYAGRTLEPTRANYKNQARFALKRFLELIDELKELGIYDSSFIILQGDHGSAFPPVTSSDSNISDFSYGEEIGFIPRVPALLVVKPPHERGDIKISNAQTSILDIAPTILDYSGMPESLEGENVFKVDPQANRERRFIVYQSGKSSSLTEFKVFGSILDPNSWNKSNRITINNKAIENYIFGAPIIFGLSGNAEQYEDEGWSSPLEGHEWNNGKSASLRIPIDSLKSDLKLEAEFMPFLVQGKVDSQRVLVYANGVEVGQWIAEESGLQKHSLIIPKNVLKAPYTELTFKFPNAASPRQLGVSTDARTLAVAMVSLKLDEIMPYEWGTIIGFGKGEKSEIYKKDGWSAAENGCTWTNGNYASLVIPITLEKPNITLKTEVMPFLNDDKIKRQRVNVLVNGEKIEEWTLDTAGLHEKSTTIPGDLLSSNNVLELAFELPDAVSPEELGINADKRILGLLFKSIQLLNN